MTILWWYSKKWYYTNDIVLDYPKLHICNMDLWNKQFF